MGKTILTPGKLYSRLSAEFGRLRSPECGSLHMPMVYMIERRPSSAANWMVDDLPLGYEACKDVVDEIVDRFSFQYDIFDPTCTPVSVAHPRASPSFAPRRNL